MAVVNSDILRIIAFNDYKHDSKPKHGVRGASPEDVKLFVTPTLPIGISSAGIFIGNEEKTMEKVFPPASDLAKGSVAPGNNLNNWTNLKEGEDAVWSGDVKNTWGKFNYTIKPLNEGTLNNILTGRRLNLVVDTKRTSVPAAAKGCKRVTWVETAETLYDPLTKVVQNMAEAAPETYWGREDPNHVSFFPAWNFKEGKVAVDKIKPLEKMFFSKYDLSLYMQKHPEKEGVFTSFMYCSPERGQCILIEGTGGITDSSLTACNTNLSASTVARNFTNFKAETIKNGVKELNHLWHLIKSTLSHGPNKEKIIETITLAAQNYHPPHFVVGKRLGDESQALACLRDLKIVTYGPEELPQNVAAMPYVNVFVTFDRLALLAALYYRVPAVIFSWAKKERENHNPGRAFIAYRSELDTPETQYKSLVARIAETLKGPSPAKPDARELHPIIYEVMRNIDGRIAAANREINNWIELEPRYHHQTTASGGSLSKAYKILLELMIYVPGIQQFALASKLHSQILDLGVELANMSPKMRSILDPKTKNPPPKVTGDDLEELVNNVQKFYDTEITYRNTIKKYNAAKKGINKPVAPADFSHI